MTQWINAREYYRQISYSNTSNLYWTLDLMDFASWVGLMLQMHFTAVCHSDSDHVFEATEEVLCYKQSNLLLSARHD